MFGVNSVDTGCELLIRFKHYFSSLVITTIYAIYKLPIILGRIAINVINFYFFNQLQRWKTWYLFLLDYFGKQISEYFPIWELSWPFNYILSSQSAYDVFESNHLAWMILSFNFVQFAFYMPAICYDNRFLQFQMPLIILWCHRSSTDCEAKLKIYTAC